MVHGAIDLGRCSTHLGVDERVRSQLTSTINTELRLVSTSAVDDRQLDTMTTLSTWTLKDEDQPSRAASGPSRNFSSTVSPVVPTPQQHRGI